MKKKKFLIGLLFVFLSFGIIQAQQSGNDLKLSLKEAQDYAIQNNKLMITSRMDVEASKAAVWNVISNALPQVNASGSFTDNLKLMTTLLPGDFFGQPGVKVPVTFGSQFNSGATFQASLSLFNANLYIAIKTTKLANSLTEKNLARTELDTRETISSSYYLILVSERYLEILDMNIANLNETLKSTKAMVSAGVAEPTDVDQMMSNVTMVEDSRSGMQRSLELNYNLLRLQLGVSPEAKISLTESLSDFTTQINIDNLLSQQFDKNQNLDYILIVGQEQMSALNLKSEKASVLPTLGSFYSYGINGMGDKVKSQQWFKNSMTGLQISVPIFSSGQRYSSIKRAQIRLDQARTTKELVTDQLLLQEKQLRYNLVNANLQYNSQKANVDVSKRVYTSTENKFKQGMASSLELTQANSLYLQAENNYVSALLNLLQTKLALDKLLNNMN